MTLGSRTQGKPTLKESPNDIAGARFQRTCHLMSLSEGCEQPSATDWGPLCGLGMLGGIIADNHKKIPLCFFQVCLGFLKRLRQRSINSHFKLFSSFPSERLFCAFLQKSWGFSLPFQGNYVLLRRETSLMPLFTLASVESYHRVWQ